MDTPKKEPIAIIGIGCRFPGGANDPKAFWKLLQDGVDAITDVPDDRWNPRTFYDPDREKPGKIYTRRGGFIERIDQFDAQFFGISPREAALIDPQHRLLLEVAYEALEDAGLVPERLAGSNTSVFVGLYIHDYQHIQLDASARNLIGAQMTTGTAMSIAANRISYVFDLRGESAALDTACSSSLVAVHHACETLWNGQATLALAGGVNAILKPDMTIGMCKASMLSPDARCKSFDAAANGFARGEGAGIAILKPLSKAIADKDPIYAVIRGTAVNQDGRTNGLTVPNGQAQEAALRAAYEQAAVSPEQIQYVEAHGTGTAVGDPIEANALGAVLGSNRTPGNDCIIGSVKSNIGHLESAAGIAGLIKAALALKHRQIPPNLHFHTPNPKIPFEKLQLRVPQSLEPWPTNGDSPRLAGVNSFGFGGTNAHIVVQEIETFEENSLPQSSDTGRQDKVEGESPLLLPLSARSEEALKAVAQETRSFLTALDSDSSVSLHDICYTASLRRGHHNHRLALVADSKEKLVEHLEAFIAGETRLGMSCGRQVPGRSPKLAFVFSGMGPQWWAMGRQLLEKEPVFRETIKQCDTLLRQYTNWSLLEELTAQEERSRINETEIAQPAIFAVQIALAALWHSWGIVPDAIVGHSVGEVASAYVAGALSLEDAVQVIFHRSRVQAKAAGYGKMLAVSMSAEEANRVLVGHEEQVSIAAINSPTSVTLSGDAEILKNIAQFLEQKQIFCRFLRVEVPYHSPKMEPFKAELIESLQGINPQSATIPLFSTVTGEMITGSELDGVYWAQNMRNAVLFAAAINEVAQAGCDLFLEISSHPVLANSISECLSQATKEGTVLPSLRRQEPEKAMMLGSFGKLYTLGYPVDWNRFYPEGGRLLRLPSYPWQRERYWQESEESQQSRLGQPSRRAMLSTQVHPLLGYQMNSAKPIWDGLIDTQQLTYLNDHCVQGSVVYPGAAYVEMALAVAKETLRQESCVVEEIQFHKALFLPESEPPTLQLILDSSSNSFEIYSKIKDAEQSWIRHATGKLTHNKNGHLPQQVVLDEIRIRCTNEIAKSNCYQQFQEIGLQYGPCFQGIEQIWSGEGEALGRLRVPDTLETQTEDYWLHPAILDACFQVTLGAVFFNSKAKGIYLPVQIDRVDFYGRPGLQLWSHAYLVEQSKTHVKANIQLLDEAGNLLVDIQGLQCQSLATGQEFVTEQVEDHLYEDRWQLKTRPGQDLVCQPADYMPSPLQISENLQPEVARLSEQFKRKQYYEKVEPQLEVLCAEYVLKALHQLGWKPKLHQRITSDSLAQELSVVSQHQSLLGRMLEILQEEGLLRQVDSQWEVCQIPEVKEPQETWKTFVAKYPAYLAELMLLGRCGQELAQVLRGEVDPLQLIFSEGSLTTSEHLYQDSPSYRIYNLLVQKTIAKALERLPEGRKVRILEIGAGTGAMTSYVLPKLPADRTEYVFTDVSQLFITSAEQKFSDYPFVEYKLLNIEADPVAQGFDAHSFDLILASDVLHATHDLKQTLENVKQVLASEGLLVVLELTNAPRWFDLVFGMLKGWWLFDDADLRASNPLLSLRKWLNLLEDVGFTEATSISDTKIADESLHTVMLAQAPCHQQEARPVKAISEQVESREDVGGRWLIFADSEGVGQQLAELLKQRQEIPILISPGTAFKRIDTHHFQICPEHPEDMQQLLEATLAEQPACRGVVHLWSLDTLLPQATTVSSLESAQHLGCLNVLHLVQALVKVDWSEYPRLWLVTRGTKAVGGSFNSVSVAQSPLWGLGRVINNEYPELHCKKVDISFTSSPAEIQSLYEEISSDDQEDEIALRGKARYVNRLTRVSPEDVGTAQKKAVSAAGQPFRLEISKAGVLEKLTLRATSRQKPGQAEVEIQVCATGLNFNDVTKATSLLADANLLEGNFPGQGLGLECAGIITAIGEGVEGFEIGDEVIAFAPHSFGSYTTTDARFVVHKPHSLSFEEAATIPLAFLTAHYALHHLGRISKGDRVLIHAAAGGVGLAAVQIAQQVGAEIFATAGNPEKRQFLQAIGIKHVMDSRSLQFANEVMERSCGKGVDIVLNSLGGEAIPKSLSVLGAYGRFIEIGKWDTKDNSKSGLRPVQNNLSFFTVDIAQLLRDRPDETGSLFREVVQLFADGTLHPLPHRVFPISKVHNAYRYMAQAKHIGKVTISLQDPEVVVAPLLKETVTFRADGTYLIAGGLGGFSLAVAQWLVENGAKRLVLMGRSGASSPAAKAAVKTLEEAGAHIVVAKADVTQEEQVKSVISDINNSMQPLRGIIHAAMVLDDALILQLNEERMQKVMKPKMVGAWNLHAQTLNIPLDFFIVFSSLASTVGNPGQGNYVAANAFLETLVYHRRVQGLPALCANWGAVTDVGYVAQNAEIGEHLKRIGVKKLPSQQGLKMLGVSLQQEGFQIAIAPVDWQQWAKFHPAGSLPRFSQVVGEADPEQPQVDDGREGDSLINTILAAEPAERQQLLVSCISEQVAKVLLTSASKLDIEQPLTALGLDSLMAVDLSNRINNELGVDIPTVKLIQGPSIAQLAAQVSEQLTQAHSSSSPSFARVVTSKLDESKAGQIDISNKVQTEELGQILAKIDQLPGVDQLPDVDQLPNALVDALLDKLSK